MNQSRTETRSRLLDAAAAMVQTRGYNGFSFHDLAASVGVRTASIHYHFPTKGDLASNLARRYREQFMATLGEPDAGTPRQRLDQYIGLFAATLADGRMCLCGMIGAEAEAVPDAVRTEVASFFAANADWLAAILRRSGLAAKEAQDRAALVLAALEGAMLVARVNHDPGIFASVGRSIAAMLPAEG